MKGTRADVRLLELDLAQSREKARSMIMAGLVFLNGARIEKPGDMIPTDAIPIVREDPNPFVSRGGLKLDKVIKKYALDLRSCVAADIGASTGGFTDCMLQNGAQKVFAIDVGYGQLDWKLRNDARVIVMERTNARNLSLERFGSPLDFAAIDVSFISVKLILPSLKPCLKRGARVVVLIKPQFEAGREKVGKHGVIRSFDTHAETVEGVVNFAQSKGFLPEYIDYSPITGPKGNIEFLLVLSNLDQKAEHDFHSQIIETVKNAHQSL